MAPHVEVSVAVASSSVTKALMVFLQVAQIPEGIQELPVRGINSTFSTNVKTFQVKLSRSIKQNDILPEPAGRKTPVFFNII